MITLDNVHKQYRLGKVQMPALRNINLEIHEGDFVALAGPSGSGKTTLLNLIGCIDKPDQGRILLRGIDVTSVPLPKLAQTRSEEIGFIFQTFNLLPVLTAFENVEYPLLFWKNKKERHALVWNWLRRVGLEREAHQRPDQLSGGQRQRVAIARAMIMEPRCILADEPTANLDSETGSEILDLLTKINLESGRTFLFATHDPKVMERARRKVCLRDGQIVSDEYIQLRSQRLVHAN